MEKLQTMSMKELSKLEVMQRLARKELKQSEAAKMLRISIRQVKRILRAYREEGVQGLVSKRRGRASNNQMGKEVKQKVLGLLKEKYDGFGPTLACEKLVEVEGLMISVECVRHMMIVEGL